MRIVVIADSARSEMFYAFMIARVGAKRISEKKAFRSLARALSLPSSAEPSVGAVARDLFRLVSYRTVPSRSVP
ncbi:hypothetical protein [Gemmatimonas sp.]|uniref:hypothetical protein n=1 Tax=Gemmatimonas sp. TaxID=1962908 RepID=UPI003569A961